MTISLFFPVVLALACRFGFHMLAIASVQTFVTHVLGLRLSRSIFLTLFIILAIVKEIGDYVVHKPELLNNLTLVRDSGLFVASLVTAGMLYILRQRLSQKHIYTIFLFSFVPLSLVSFFFTRIFIPGTQDIWYKHVLDVVSWCFGSWVITPWLELFFSPKGVK